MGQNALFEKYGRTCQANDYICREGEQGKEMYLILAGEVIVHKRMHGEKKVIATLGPGEFFGEMSLLEGEPRFATVQALGEVKMLVVNLNILEQYVGINPDFGITMLKKFSSRLRKHKLYKSNEE